MSVPPAVGGHAATCAPSTGAITRNGLTALPHVIRLRNPSSEGIPLKLAPEGSQRRQPMATYFQRRECQLMLHCPFAE